MLVNVYRANLEGNFELLSMLQLATLEETAKLAQVKEGFDEAAVLARFQWLASYNATWYVWWEVQEPCGWALIQWQGKPSAPHSPDLFDLHVHPSWRNRGIGTQILYASEAIVRAAGYAKLGLAVNPDLNPRAYTLYLRLGYSPVSGVKYLDGIYNGVEDWVIDLEKNV